MHLLETGDRLHIVTRRLFDGDIRRHFVGAITQVSTQALRAEGYVFVFDSGTGKFVRRPEVRTRIFSLIDANLVINILPKDVEVAGLGYRLNNERRLIVTDELNFKMDIDEYNVR